MFINILCSSIAHSYVKFLILLSSPHYGLLIVIIDWPFSLFLTCFSKLSLNPSTFLHEGARANSQSFSQFFNAEDVKPQNSI